MGITGRGKIGSSNDINTGEYTAPESKGSLGFDFDTPRIGNPSNSIRDSIIGSGPKAPKSSIGLGVGASPVGNLGLGLEIPLPVAAPVSARGGVSIDPATGEIRGGYGGLGIGKGPVGASVDVGVDTPKGSEDFGCFKYVTFNVGPFSHTVSKNECEPKSPNKSSSTSTSSPPSNRIYTPNIYPPGSDKNCEVWLSLKGEIRYFYQGFYEVVFTETTVNYSYTTNQGTSTRLQKKRRVGAGYDTDWVIIPSDYDSMTFTGGGATEYRRLAPSGRSVYDSNIGNATIISGREDDIYQYISQILDAPKTGTGTYSEYVHTIVAGQCDLPDNKTEPINNNVPNLINVPQGLPNPPPTKKKMDDKCCKAIIQLQLETLRLLGRQLGPKGVMAQSKEKGFIGEEIERTLTPIDNPNNPEKVKVRFTTVYQMLMYALKQGIALDTALDPQSYKVPTGKLQNPAYSRDSEHSLKSNNQPSKDKAGNSRELEINKDDAVKMSGFLQQQSYMFKMMQRLEYLFPPGELKDALIAKSLLIPGAKGDIKIHNMIMAYEVQMQYLDATLGNPREILTIKDANPAIEGDQPIEIQSLSVSDLLRQNIKFHIDTGGDVDALVNLVLRDFRTNLANRLDQIKTAEMVQALFEDSGMLEKQEYVDVHLEGDPYAGQWIKGQGFKANPDLEKKTEESTEKVLRETMKPTEQRVKVSRRHKDEKTDMRDLLRGLADFIQRLLSIPSAGDAGKSIDQLVESAKFKIQTDMALLRQNVTQAAAASRNRTKKRKK